MDACIQYNIVYIGRLCAMYCDGGKSRPHMDEVAGFCYDLLVRLMCLILPLEEWGQCDNVISLVDNGLKVYVEFYEKSHKKVRLTGFNDNGDCEDKCEKVNHYLWYFFSYTYHFISNDEINRSKFLWISLILPYLYKMNQFGVVTVEDLNKLLRDYPIDENTLETLQESTGEFRALLSSAVGIFDDLMPTRIQIDAIVGEAIAGLKIAVELREKVR